MKTKQFCNRRLLPVMAVLCVLLVLFVGLSVSASAAETSYTAGDISGTTGGGQSAEDPVKVNRFEELKAALENPYIKYVELTGIEQQSGEAKGQQKLPYEISTPPGMMGNHAIYVEFTKYLKISEDATFISGRSEYGALIFVSGTSELHVYGSGSLTYSHNASTALIQAGGGKLYVGGTVKLRTEAGSRKDTNIYLPAIFASSYDDRDVYVNISDNVTLEGSVYENDSQQLLDDKSYGTNQYNYRGAVELIGNVRAEISGGTFRAGSLKKRTETGSIYYQSLSYPVGLRVAKSTKYGSPYTPTVKITGGTFSGIYYHTDDTTASIGRDLLAAGYIFGYESNGYPWLGKTAGDLKTPFSERDAYTPNYTFYWTALEVLNLKDSVSFESQPVLQSNGAAYLDRFSGNSENYSFRVNFPSYLAGKGYTVTKIYRHGFADELSAWTAVTEDTANFKVTYPKLNGSEKYYVYIGVQIRHSSGNTVLYSEVCSYEITLHEKTEIGRVRISVENPSAGETLYSNSNTYRAKFMPVIESELPYYTSDNPPFTMESCLWTNAAGGKLGATLAYQTTFDAGDYFGVQVILKAKDGYRFSKNTVSLGDQFQVYSSTDDMLILQYAGSVDQPISLGYIELLPPLIGGTPGANKAKAVNGTEENVQVLSTVWQKKIAGAPDSAYAPMGDGESFASSYDYRCTVTLYAKYGYEFTSSVGMNVYPGGYTTKSGERVSRKQYRLEVYYPALSVDVIDVAVEQPDAGDPINQTAAGINCLTEGYTVTGATYQKYNFVTGQWGNAGTAFAAGERYRVTVVLQPMTQFTFKNSTLFSVNNTLVQAATLTSSQATFTYEFELAYDSALHIVITTSQNASVGNDSTDFVVESTFLSDEIGAGSVSTSVSMKDTAGNRFSGTFVYGETYTAQFTTKLTGITAVPEGLLLIVDGQRVQYTGTYVPAYGGCVLTYSIRYTMPESPADYGFSILWKEGSSWEVLGKATIDANTMMATYPALGNPSYHLAFEWYVIKDGETMQIPVDSMHIYDRVNYTCYFSPDMSGCQVFAVAKLMFGSFTYNVVKSEVKTIREWDLTAEGLHESVQLGDIVYPASLSLDNTFNVLPNAEYAVKWTWNSLSAAKLEQLEKYGYEVLAYYETCDAYGSWSGSAIDVNSLVESAEGTHSYYAIAEADSKTRLRILITDGDNAFDVSNVLTLVETPWVPVAVHTNVSLDGAIMGVNPTDTPFKTSGETHRITFTYQIPKDLLASYEAYYPYESGGYHYDTVMLNGAGYTVTPVCTADGKEVEGILADLGGGLFSYTVDVNDSRSPYSYSVSLRLDIKDHSGTPVVLAVPENRVSMLLLAVDNFTSGHTVSGTVTSYTDDAVTIVLLDAANNPVHSAVAFGANAVYSIKGVADGAYTMCVTKENYGQYIDTLTVAGEDVVKDITMIQISEFGTFTYYGTVSGEGTGETCITLSNPELGYHKLIAGTGESLAFSFADLQPGTYAVYATKGSLVAYDSYIIISDADVKEDIELMPEYVAGTHRIMGTVTATDMIIAPIEITLKKGDEVIATDNDDYNWWTSFEFKNLEDGEYTLTVGRYEHTSVTLTVNITEESDNVIDLGIIHLDSLHRVLGNIKSEAGPNPVTVTLTPAGETEALRSLELTFASDGWQEYSMSDVPSGEYVLRVERLGYQTYTTDVSVKDTSHIYVPDITLVPLPTYTVSGTVSSESGTAPVTVKLIPAGKTEPVKTATGTDLTMAFSWSDVPVGEYVIRAEKEGYETKSVNVTVVDANVAVPAITLTAIPTPPTVYTVSGTVSSASGTDAVTVKLYVSGATDPLKTHSSTDLTTAFSWSDVPAGTYLLRVEKNGYQTQIVDVTVTNANVAVPAITLVPVVSGANVTVNCVGTITYTVSGQVVTVDHEVACKVGYLDGGKYVAIAASANGDGTYSFIAPTGVTEVLLVVKGDVNGDGKCNTSDYGRLNAAILEKISLSPEAAFAADVNGDDKCNTSDYGRLNAVFLSKTTLTW